MPTFLHGKNAQILLNEFDLSAYLNEVAPSADMDMHDLTTFGNSDKVMAPGLGGGQIDCMGFYSISTVVNYPESIFASLEAAATAPLVSAAPNGFAIGQRAFLLQAHEEKHEMGIKKDAFIINKASFKSTDGFDFGISLHDKIAAEVSTANAASVDNLAATANGGVGFIHVIAIGGTGSPTLTAKIQHSVDNSVWADLITFTAATAITKERIVVAPATTIRRYLRATWTISGSSPTFTFVIAFARRF